MKTTTITCDGCGATTSEAMRPEGWACLHVFLYDAEGNPKPSGQQDRCARCMLVFLAPPDRDERRERPTIPDDERATSDGQCGVHHNGVRCLHPYAHRGAHDFRGENIYDPSRRDIDANGKVKLRCLVMHPDVELQCGLPREHAGSHGEWRPGLRRTET